jgi:hypothetical protein
MINTIAKIVGITPMVDTPFATFACADLLAFENVVFRGTDIDPVETTYRIPGTNTTMTAITIN